MSAACLMKNNFPSFYQRSQKYCKLYYCGASSTVVLQPVLLKIGNSLQQHSIVARLSQQIAVGSLQTASWKMTANHD